MSDVMMKASVYRAKGPSAWVCEIMPSAADGERAIAPRILEVIAPVAREDEVHPERCGGVAERADLIAGGRGDEKNGRLRHDQQSKGTVVLTRNSSMTVL
jgi:hypothetical protein